MKKTFIAIFCVLIFSMTAIFASACSFFGGSEEVRQIEKIYSEPGVNDEGVTGTYIVIVYEGGEYPESRFFIADPEPGKEGTGISNITHKQNADGTTTVTIEYTDPSRYPAEFTVPNGLYIQNIIPAINEETGERTLKIVFSDPTMEPLVLTIPSGKDGKNGDSIKNIYTDYDLDGNIVVHIIVSRQNPETGEWIDEEMEPFTIPKGERGSGIAYVEVNSMSYEDVYNYYLDIWYDNGEVNTITIPRSSNWYTGKGKPGGGAYNIGDFYIDTAGYAIYRMQATGWVELINLSAYSTAEHTVYFYIDDEGNLNNKFKILHGNSFMSADERIPTPARDGYKFIGWFTEYVNPDDEGAEINPNSGQFTDLTPVLCDMILYARWQKIN